MNGQIKIKKIQKLLTTFCVKSYFGMKISCNFFLFCILKVLLISKKIVKLLCFYLINLLVIEFKSFY